MRLAKPTVPYRVDPSSHGSPSMIKRHFNELEEIQFPSLGQHGATTLRIASNRLEIGMYVVELDGAWSGSSFPKTGMLLADPHQLAAMRARSESALIDIERSDP